MKVRTPRSRCRIVLLAAAAITLLATPAIAQEAAFTEAATMPSPGTYVLRQQFNYFKFGAHPEAETESSDLYESVTEIGVGLERAWAARLDIPVRYRQTESADGDDSDRGVGDLDLTFKYRFYQSDTAGVDTVRAAVLFGAAFASGDDKDFSSTSINPHIGAVITAIRGRHGINQELTYQWNTGGDESHNYGGEGPDDALRYNTAYLYRIAPSAYTADTTGAWYLTAELNGLYETNGDNEIRFSPGLMYEGRTIAVELRMQLPLYDDLDRRAELDYGAGVALRFSF